MSSENETEYQQNILLFTPSGLGPIRLRKALTLGWDGAGIWRDGYSRTSGKNKGRDREVS